MSAVPKREHAATPSIWLLCSCSSPSGAGLAAPLICRIRSCCAPWSPSQPNMPSMVCCVSVLRDNVRLFKRACRLARILYARLRGNRTSFDNDRKSMSLSEFAEKVVKTLAFHARRTRRALRRMRWLLSPRPAERPIIEIGCSRAGTTLVYKTLSESCEFGSLQRETHDYWTDLHPLADKDW